MYVDFHSHILPGADHGSKNLETSLSQIENAYKAGVDTIVATPHFYPQEDTVEAFLARRQASYDRLMSADLKGIKIIQAAEVQLTAGIENLEDLPKLCVEGTNYILLEFPPEPWPHWIYLSVAEIARSRKLRPIIAHIDRYSRVGREKILKLNVDVQINASALLDSWRYRKYYLNLIADDAIHVLGSDCHGDGTLDYKKFTRAVKKTKNLIQYMTSNAHRIISSGER